VNSLPWRGHQCPVAAELFATTADAYVVLGELAEERDATWTADGRPLTREFAHERLARMVCADRTQFNADDAAAAAQYIRRSQLESLRAGLRAVLRNRPGVQCVVISGAGEFLARAIVNEEFPSASIVSMARKLGLAVSNCAPAHAVAVLAGEPRQPPPAHGTPKNANNRGEEC
jgi:(4-(4-[2-(gamma-L-glutamylamino)ethyl]phenoxymethyl)furan-2-yl)methanamine synthase